MRKFANGWTAESVLEQVKKYNNGTRAKRGDATDICTYQTKDGNRCFIGAFIPDGHAALKSYKGVIDLLSLYHDLASLMPFDETEDLSDFQLCHDKARENFKGNTYSALEDFLADYLA